MKRILWIAIVSYILTGCSAFERKVEDANEPPFPPSNAIDDASALTPSTGGQAPSAGGDNYMENELARLNSKVEALETKLASLSDNIQVKHDQAAQPKLRAEHSMDSEGAATKLNADHDVDPEMDAGKALAVETMHSANKLPHGVKTSVENVSSEDASIEAAAPSTGSVEKDFQNAMKLMDAKKFKEAANQFFSIAKQNRNHSLASHALYWAGEAGSRARNWKIAISHWSNLEANYPRSIYIADALAGLASAYAANANTEQANHYREVLMKAFPDSPAASSLTANIGDAEKED